MKIMTLSHHPQTRAHPLPTRLRVAQAGVTLIELLVAMIIGLLGIVVIFTVFQNAEGYKRTTIAGGDAQSNGSIALFSIERYVRTSGSSITTTNESQLSASAAPVRPNMLLGCPLMPNPNSAAVVTAPAGAPSTPIAPVRIVDGSLLAGGIASTSDALVIMAGNADISTNPTGAGPLTTGLTAIPVMTNTFGWRLSNAATPTTLARAADIALFVRGGVGTAAVISPDPCSARRITALSNPAGTGTMTLAAGIPTAYTGSTNIHNLGPTGYFLSIAVNGQNQLVQTDFMPVLTGEGPAIVTVLADGIISIQAQYGIDNNQDDVIDQWVEPTGAWANPTAINPPTGPAPAPQPPAINHIKAIRVAILARAAQFEAPNRNVTPPVCNVTMAPAGGWFLLPAVPATGGSLAQPQGADILPAIVASGPSQDADSNWSCFRYRTYETVIPIINMIRSPL